MSKHDAMPEPVLITSSSALESLIKTLQRQPILAVDTESNSLYAYQEQVCLIQFSIPGSDFLVDPLSLPDLNPLGEIFQNPGIEKVFHAAEYDLICLKRDYNFEFANIFDTMIAARILRRKEVGLGSLLQKEFGVVIDKRFQRANWGQRPLPTGMLSYAQLDTHYLIELRNILHKELVETKLSALADEDFKRTTRVNGNNNKNNTCDCWRINGAYDLPAQRATVLRELCQYRDRTARAMNRPLFKVISDATLLAIAENAPTRLEVLERLPGMTSRQIKRHGAALLEAVKRGLKADPIYPEHHPRPDETYLNRVEQLKNWRKITAQRLGVPSDVVLPRTLVQEIAEQNPKTPKELEKVMREAPWRLKHYGVDILNVLQKANIYY